MVASENDARSRVWSRILATNPPQWIKSIRIIESEVFEEQVIELDSAICIVGSHGAGKTLLLRVIQAAFGFGGGTPPFVGAEGYGNVDNPVVGVIELTVSVDGNEEKKVIDLAGSVDERFQAWATDGWQTNWPAYVSSAELANDFTWYYQELPHSKKRLLNEQRFKSSELVALAGILGKKYDSVSMWTVVLDSRSDDDESWYQQRPYVISKTAGRESDNTSFSLGELWVYQVLWEQGRLDAGSMFMLDEPESFLALRGHRAFIDEVARRALKGKLQLIVATHSPQVFSRFPLKNVRMCVRGSRGKIRVVEPESLVQVQRAVGLEIPVAVIVLVEDAFASLVLVGVLGCLNASIAGIEVVQAGGKDNVIAGVRCLSSASRVRVIGVLDADQRDFADSSNGLFLLPGKSDPEQELIGFAYGNSEAVAAALGRSETALLVALGGFEFFEHQRWPDVLATQLGLDLRFVTSVLIRLWCQQEDIRRQAFELAAVLA
ncbi:AAA family ATPase [Plantactinospora soyae]|uniref:ATPase n=1 Tax=Plantactinospora soyae TaxID=1544732 RepID=A0A927MJ89_9ACTN|nr:hypothetical protein [Plantactinospora soyae]MBE1492593.1 putative ATPase [Plantactinospora soyae]